MPTLEPVSNDQRVLREEAQRLVMAYLVGTSRHAMRLALVLVGCGVLGATRFVVVSNYPMVALVLGGVGSVAVLLWYRRR